MQQIISSEAVAFIGTCDLAGLLRGKGVPEADLERRMEKGVGYVHANIMMSAFGPIYATPFGTDGDLMLVPDPDTRVDVAFGEHDREFFFLSDLLTLDRAPWSCCPRGFLRRALAALAEVGLSMQAAFEQEFVYTGVEMREGTSYAFDLLRRSGDFGGALLAAMRAAGLEPDSFLPEYGARQFEVTVKPRPALRAADEAVILREMARAVAWRRGERAIFAPMPIAEGIGNGTHVHMSLYDGDGRPVLHDPSTPLGLSPVGQKFAAGILAHLPALAAVTAPSAASYYRLRPNRWAPTRIDLGRQDRGSALRLCPLFAPRDAAEAARAYNMEYRVADATASPWMALGAVVWAGVDGIRRDLELPGAGHAAPALPSSLKAALAALEADPSAELWFGREFLDVYLMYKRAELEALADHDEEAVCARYAAIY